MFKINGVVGNAILAAALVSAAAIATGPGDDHSHDGDHSHGEHGGMPQLHDAHPLASAMAEMADADPDAMMEAWASANAPGKQHEWLSHFVGSWDTTSKFWMDPAAPPMESTGTAQAKMILGGRYVMEEFSGDMMGQPFQGLGITGYDKLRKQFVSTWMDSMSTAIITMHGSMSMDGSSIALFGELDDAMTGEVGKPVKWVSRIIDKDHHVAEAWEVSYDEPFMVMQIEYRRRK